MPGFVFNAFQMRGLLEAAEVDVPGPGSPLRSLPPLQRGPAPGEPDFDDLVNKGIFEPNKNGVRMNSVMKGVIRACAHPEEVLNVGVSNDNIGGYSVVQRGNVSAECTVDRTGVTKIHFPVEPGAAFLSIIGSLSSKGREKKPEDGFHFLGPPEDAFVLANALRELREDPRPMTNERLAEAVARAADAPRFAAAFALAAGPETIEALKDPAKVLEVLDRLQASGHLIEGEQGITADSHLQELLGTPPEASFAVSRTVVNNGQAKVASIQTMKVGGRMLVFRERNSAGRQQFEWLEVNRKMLRGLIGALLAVRVADATPKKPPPEAPKPKPEPKVKANPPPPPPPKQEAGWTPTHRLPAEGLPVWDAPGAAQPTTNADGNLEIKVIQWNGAWAQVEFSNGWTGWLDGRYLQELR